MLRNVIGNAVDRRLGLADLAVARELALEVGPLVGRQVPADSLEPSVDAVDVYVLLDMPSLVQQRHDGAVLDRLVDGINVDETTELGRGALLLFHQRRPGKTEITGSRKHPLHPR